MLAKKIRQQIPIQPTNNLINNFDELINNSNKTNNDINSKIKYECDNCKCIKFIKEKHGIICEKCGVILSSVILETQEDDSLVCLNRNMLQHPSLYALSLTSCNLAD